MSLPRGVMSKVFADVYHYQSGRGGRPLKPRGAEERFEAWARVAESVYSRRSALAKCARVARAAQQDGARSAGRCALHGAVIISIGTAVPLSHGGRAAPGAR